MQRWLRLFLRNKLKDKPCVHFRGSSWLKAWDMFSSCSWVKSEIGLEENSLITKKTTYHHLSSERRNKLVLLKIGKTKKPGVCAIQGYMIKRNQSWIFIGRTDGEAETPILWPPDAKRWLIWKDPDAGKDWVWEEKGTTEDEMARWLHQLDGHKYE